MGIYIKSLWKALVFPVENAGPERKSELVGESMEARSVLTTSCSNGASTPQAPTPSTKVFLQLYWYFFYSQLIAQILFTLGHFLAGNTTLSASSIKTNKDLCTGSEGKHLF